MLPPGSTIGILGGGQLGRMLASAAAELGYRTHILAPDAESVAAQTASSFTRADYHSRIVLDEMAARCDVVTYEFENIAVEPVEYLARHVPVHPNPHALAVAQDRASEKAFVESIDGRTAPWRRVATLDELTAALGEIGAPAILKTLRLGYDGKGQVRIADASGAQAAWDAIGRRPAILEGFVDFTHEFSIILARGADGAMVSYPPPWNEHVEGILARSSLPAPAEIASQWGVAAALTGRIADALDYVGVLACEFFACSDGPVLNEMAPRVHNSGHWTIEGAVASQFENHIRAICGLPLGDTALTAPEVVMENLIGDADDDWAAILAEPGAHLHLYGKNGARPGRKMGHVTRLKRSL
ncbi:5-(carboxyamino)imidazole ribonucleotide synthase [Sphingomonas sp.]|jgi:5-(carboxyamino)imidazole ribonucleotide synthase|uniref:5-(carboxyamino)imidazole ribonucleotide synthase n=1 Tax=Sphingomonas sp. TaxID=28214 RepID=UPI002E342744|nr:5-(carboxyamino)imidazole ribonucleotide synthase [Sphingomonas sp.]HEX4692925.1 5-(carboxyamino)imidazole ribonucleotide synthase [Sphingomonas sp.]